VAGKTGTAQKLDPKTGTYSKTKYIASFVGFAPVNEPALTVAVILDSAEGLHQGGQVCAPVFRRIAQQVLEYMHVPHDLEVKNDAKRQRLLASAKEADLDESSDHLGTPMVMDDNDANGMRAAATRNMAARASGSSVPQVIPAAVQQPPTASDATAFSATPTLSGLGTNMPVPPRILPGGTVVLDTNSGMLVPSFLGKSVRGAVESAQQAGIEISVLGTGIAREQFPPAGSRLSVGQRVTLRFAR